MGRKVSKIVEQVEQKTKRKPNQNIKKIKLISTSSTLLNLACSENPEGGLATGGMINLIGDSHTGKTIVALSILAECANDPKFDDYDFYFDDAENANLFDMEYLFGKKTAKRIKPPYIDDEGMPAYSRWIEDFHCNIADAFETGRPFIYILDSFDAIESEQDSKKVEEMRDARRKNKKTAGSYGMSKPKKASELLRNICADLKNTESLLIIISQTRDNIDPISFQKKTRSGGKALKFYAIHEIWLANIGSIKGKNGRIIGGKVRAKVTKNKLTGKVREADLKVFYDYGVDDITPSIEFMVDEGFWKKSKNTINAEDLELQGTVSALVKQIEDKGLEKELAEAVASGWEAIEEELKLKRKPKYE